MRDKNKYTRQRVNKESKTEKQIQIERQKKTMIVMKGGHTVVMNAFAIITIFFFNLSSSRVFLTSVV